MESTANNESYNEDELVAPDWMNAEFFREVLSKHEKDPELKVFDVKMSPASGKGDHYASIMFRGNVEYTTPKGKFSKSLIVKTMPEQEGPKKDMLSGSHIFETEINMYSKALPKFEEILRAAGDETRLCVSCIYHSIEPRQILIFDDLVQLGYEVVRDRFCTNDEIKAAYSKLAKWQAVSFKILQENPEFLGEFKHGMNSMAAFMENPYITTGMPNFLESLDKTPELTKYKPFFEKIKDTYMDSFKKIIEEYRVNRQPNGYYVLCHGDYHLKNMMFKHNKANGALEDCMLLDFQVSNVCPISIDIIYSTYMLLSPEQRQDNYKELIEYYFSVFVETLKAIGYKGDLPHEVEFWNQLARHKYYELFQVITLLPMMHGLYSQTLELSEMLENNEGRKKAYFLDGFVEEVKCLLPRFDKLGYFE